MVRFTDEEGFGRYLDLHEQHIQFSNLYDIFEERPQYLAYLTKFDKFAHIPRAKKTSAAYKKYVWAHIFSAVCSLSHSDDSRVPWAITCDVCTQHNPACAQLFEFWPLSFR